MDFDHLLAHFSDSAGQKEHVALAIYHLEEIVGQDQVTQSEVRNLIQKSRSTINESSIPSYFRRLDGDWITSTGNGAYRLSNPGRKGVKKLLADDALESTRDEEELFIDFDQFEDERYQHLVSNINECYRHRINDAVMVLTRKLFEDLVYNILVGHYAGKKPEMYYDIDNQRHYRFDELLDNMKDGIPDLRQYSPLFEKKTIEALRDLKNAGNKGAHVIRIKITEDEMDEYAGETDRLIRIIYQLWWGVQQGKNNSSNSD